MSQWWTSTNVEQLLQLQGRKRIQLCWEIPAMDLRMGIEVSGYFESEWGGCIDTRRSTTGYTICVNGGGVISWNSKCQPTVALSSAEAEHMAMSAAV